MTENMGGKGSGRHARRPTLESLDDVLELSVAYLRACGMARGKTGYIDYEDPEARFYAEIKYDLRTMPGTLHVSHLTRHRNVRARRLVNYSIEVSAVPSNLGQGELYGLHCPARLEIRVTHLILPIDGARFLSRKAYRTPYESERASKAARLVMKAKKKHAAGGGTGDWRVPLKKKPRGMHTAVFERLREEHRQIVRAARSFEARHKTEVKRKRRERAKQRARVQLANGR